MPCVVGDGPEDNIRQPPRYGFEGVVVLQAFDVASTDIAVNLLA